MTTEQTRKLPTITEREVLQLVREGIRRADALVVDETRRRVLSCRMRLTYDATNLIDAALEHWVFDVEVNGEREG